jgi:hypothetical protein
MARLNSDATSNMGAIVQVSRENLALALLWGAIGACALMTLLSPTMTAAGAEGNGLSKIMASLVRAAF